MPNHYQAPVRGTAIERDRREVKLCAQQSGLVVDWEHHKVASLDTERDRDIRIMYTFYLCSEFTTLVFLEGH